MTMLLFIMSDTASKQIKHQHAVYTPEQLLHNYTHTPQMASGRLTIVFRLLHQHTSVWLYGKVETKKS